MKRFPQRLISTLALTLAAGLAHAAGFTLESPTIKNGKPLPSAQVYKGFGCDGGNTSPVLRWHNPPAGTKSFALTVYDPDAPTGSGWWHWVVYDIPADVTELSENAGTGGGAKLPAGAKMGRTDYGTQDFGGACPPPGSKPHRYIFTVFALKTDKLELPADPSPAMVGFNLNANKLGTARLTATYRR